MAEPCEHAWVPFVSTYDPVAEGFYICSRCYVLGSKDPDGCMLVERCIFPDCIAPATGLTEAGNPVCENCEC